MFLKKYVPNVKYILFDISPAMMDFVKGVFKDKYLITDSDLDGIIAINKYTDLYNKNLHNVLIVDRNTFEYINVFISNAKHIFAYSNEEHKYLNTKKNLTFYGWYDYQPFNKKTRFKFYKELHKTYNSEKQYTYLTSPLENYGFIINKYKISTEKLITKSKMNHTKNLFEKVKKIIYYHNGFKLRDTNNRMIVEAGIHDIEVEVYFNGFYEDSVSDRYNLVKNNRVKELYLTRDDILISDFIESCKTKE
jgi:hypothetical protein